MIIYTITNTVTNKVYVGQTRRPHRRWYEHLNNLNKYVSLIDRAIQKHGKDVFEYKVIDSADNLEELNRKETEWIQKLDTIHPKGYNLVAKGDTKVISEHTREKMREAQKLRAANYPATQETRDKISSVHKGVKKSKEQVEKMVNSHRSKRYLDLALGSNTGIAGVRHRVEPSKYIDQYIAFMTIAGSYKSKCFSVKKYGTEKALELAIEARKEFEEMAKQTYDNKTNQER